MMRMLVFLKSVELIKVGEGCILGNKEQKNMSSTRHTMRVHIENLRQFFSREKGNGNDVRRVELLQKYHYM